MGIKDKQTYGEYYWAMQVEAAAAFDESIEKTLSSQVAPLLSGLGIFENIPDLFAPLLSSIAEPESPGYGGILGRFVSEAADGILGQSMQHALKDFNYKMAEWFSDERIDFPTACTLKRRQAIPDEMFSSRMSAAGFKDAEGTAFYTANMPYPSIPELITYARYHGNPYNTRNLVWEWFDVPARDYDLWEWLGLQRLNTMQIHTAWRRKLIDDNSMMNRLAQVGWSAEDRTIIKHLDFQIPNAMLMVQGGLIQGLSTNDILSDISYADIHPQHARKYLDAVLTKPASQDLVAYHLRQDPSLSMLGHDLTKIGIHPDYLDVYKTLAYQIPPIADIITMAVREAFSPAIAEKFGQYQDFPPDFERYAAMKGLTPEWAKRYWAAHWALPSPQQGFEMLHRGVITDQELNLLLRAQDVMPFWRDKLVQIAYRTLTRVDVRRMYALGVLDETEIVEAYLQHGYNPENARRMATFTVKQTLATQSKFTSGDVVKAFTQRMINRSEAMSLLNMIGIQRENALHIINTAEYKRLWEFTDEQISGVRNLYRKKVYDENTARNKLAQLNLPSDQIEVLMKQWWYEKRAEQTATWTTAQALRFYKRRLIPQERLITELTLNGYDEEHIEVLLRDAKWVKPKS